MRYRLVVLLDGATSPELDLHRCVVVAFPGSILIGCTLHECRVFAFHDGGARVGIRNCVETGGDRFPWWAWIAIVLRGARRFSRVIGQEVA